MSTHDANCPWIYGGECNCGLASDAAERDSLRRDLAVKSAALAQCATALGDAALYLRSAQRLIECGAVNGTPWFAGLVDLIASLPAVLANPDVDHAVRVEAARDAALRTADKYRKAFPQASAEQWDAFYDAFDALDALTSERKS